MKNIYILVSLSIFIFSCTQEKDNLPNPTEQIGSVLQSKDNIISAPEGETFTREELNSRIFEEMRSRRDFRWTETDLKTIWSGAKYANLIAVGYKPANAGDILPEIDKIDIKSESYKKVHDELISLVLQKVNGEKGNLTAADIIEEDDQTLPIIIFRLKDKEAITALYNLKNVRYIEPYGYWPESTRSSSGCNSSSEPLNTADYTSTTPNALIPWNYNNCNIPAAWNLAQGNGIRIGVIDAGLSSSQGLLGSRFKEGASNVTGRAITTDYTYGTSAFASCTHGTSMSGLAAGPRNNSGAVSGVAYGSSLHFIRGCADVVLDESAELSGVRNALVRMGNLSNIRIISMSIGTPFYSSTLLDGVTYAYNKGKMIFAAAGTSFSLTSWWGVIYPASFSQCLAITGVNESGNTCASCHDGSKVIFTIPMERNSNSSRNSLSLAPSGNLPTYIGGSSAATATSAGIAALVWSVKPSLTRDQVYQCLRNTSQYYPTLTSSRGYGNLNANAAVVMATGM